MGTDPAVRGHVMTLYMMVFMGGAALGAPIAGWITDAYGVRAGLAVGGAIAAVAIGLVLARVGARGCRQAGTTGIRGCASCRGSGGTSGW